MIDKTNYTVRELMDRLRISRTKAYELLASGEIDCIRIGRRLLVPAEAIERFERQHRKEAL